MSEYQDPWLMEILVLDSGKDEDFNILDQAIRGDLHIREKEHDSLSLKQRLIVAKFFIGKRELSDAADFIEAWTGEICEGVTLREAIIGRLQTEATKEFAEKVGTSYKTAYYNVLGKLKKYESRKGLSRLFWLYNRNLKSVEINRDYKKTHKDDWEEEDDHELIFKPITEDDLLWFGANRPSLIGDMVALETARKNLKEHPEDSDRGHTEKIIKNGEMLVKVLEEFRRWLTPEEYRAAFE